MDKQNISVYAQHSKYEKYFDLAKKEADKTDASMSEIIGLALKKYYKED